MRASVVDTGSRWLQEAACAGPSKASAPSIVSLAIGSIWAKAGLSLLSQLRAMLSQHHSVLSRRWTAADMCAVQGWMHVQQPS